MWFAQVTPDWSGLAAARRDVEKPTKKLPTDVKDQVNQVIAEVRGELLGVVGELKVRKAPRNTLSRSRLASDRARISLVHL